MKIKNFIYYFIIIISITNIYAYSNNIKYKFLIQMKNYTGNEAYIAISLIDNITNKFVKTLKIMGNDKQWYNNLEEWHKNTSLSKEKIDAVTSASIPAGNRTITIIPIDEKYINKNYKIIIESVVENNKYFNKEIELNVDKLKNPQIQVLGNGYIKFIKVFKI